MNTHTHTHTHTHRERERERERERLCICIYDMMYEDRALVGHGRVEVVLLARLVDRDAFEHDPFTGAAHGVRHLP